MQLTPIERRKRLEMMLRGDEEYGKILTEYEVAKERFTKITDRIPGPMGQLLWKFPGTGYFLHHRALSLIAENMRFEDEM